MLDIGKSKTDTPLKENPSKTKPKSKTDLTVFEKEQFELIQKQFELNHADTKDGLMSIKLQIKESSDKVIEELLILFKQNEIYLINLNFF